MEDAEPAVLVLPWATHTRKTASRTISAPTLTAQVEAQGLL